ncbi:MAG: hypothetical protein PHQ23_05650 [Candidatus Wallbacteria bacterium]|nr:hypothetical protein [Candidatus Wallbacteria bacterium]
MPAEKKPSFLDVLRIIPEDSEEYRILNTFHTKEFLKDEEMFRPGTILSARDIALITVYLLVKVDEIKNYGINYFVTFQDLHDLLLLVNKYSGEIHLLLPEKKLEISKKVAGLEKKLDLGVKVTNEPPPIQ